VVLPHRLTERFDSEEREEMVVPRYDITDTVIIKVYLGAKAMCSSDDVAELLTDLGKNFVQLNGNDFGTLADRDKNIVGEWCWLHH
jgi:hypothetical protein